MRKGAECVIDNVASTVQRRKPNEIRVNKTIQKKGYKTKRKGYKTKRKEYKTIEKEM